jgi:hypothetical protein
MRNRIEYRQRVPIIKRLNKERSTFLLANLSHHPTLNIMWYKSFFDSCTQRFDQDIGFGLGLNKGTATPQKHPQKKRAVSKKHKTRSWVYGKSVGFHILCIIPIHKQYPTQKE